MDKFKSIFLGLEIAYGQYQPGERGDNGKQKGKLLLFVDKSQMNSGQTILPEKDQPLESSLLHKIMIAGGGALILTNTILIILASLKVSGILNFH